MPVVHLGGEQELVRAVALTPLRRREQVGGGGRDADRREPGDGGPPPAPRRDLPRRPFDGHARVEEQDGDGRQPVAAHDGGVHEGAHAREQEVAEEAVPDGSSAVEPDADQAEREHTLEVQREAEQR